MLGTLIGVLFLGVVQNGLTLSDVSSFWHGTVSGAILIAAVGLGVRRDRGWSLRSRRNGPHGGFANRHNETRMAKLSATAAVVMAALAIARPAGAMRTGRVAARRRWRTRTRSGRSPASRTSCSGSRPAPRSSAGRRKSIDANLSPDKQVADIATMVAQGQDGIASWTLDPGAAAGAYSQAQAAHIPVVGVNSEGTGIDATVWWEINLLRPRFADRGARTVHRRGEAGREGARDRRPARPVDPGVRAVLRREREEERAHDRRHRAQHEGHGRYRAADRRGPADQEPRRRRHLGLQRRLCARRVRGAHRRRREGLRRLGRRRDRVRPERRRRRDQGDQGTAPHRDARSGPGRHRLGADQGAVRVHRSGQGRRPSQGARGQECQRGRWTTSTTTGRRASAGTRSTRCRSWTLARAEPGESYCEGDGCPRP